MAEGQIDCQIKRKYFLVISAYVRSHFPCDKKITTSNLETYVTNV